MMRETTRVEVEIIYCLVLDVPPAGAEEDRAEELARPAIAAVRGMSVPPLLHPQTGEPIDPEVWYFGEVHPGCPKAGYGSAHGENADGRCVTRSVVRRLVRA